MKKQLLPWIFLLLLVFLVVFSAGIKQGAYVERENIKKSLSVSISPTPSKTATIEVRRVKGTCGVSYLLPYKVATQSADVKILCDTKNVDDSPETTKKGYEKTPVPRSNPSAYVWTNISSHLRELVRESIQIDDETK